MRILPTKSFLRRFFDSVKNEIIENQAVYFLLSIILLGAFFVRVYRAGDLMGFYYDQGRDALVIWDLWRKGELFLIGPVTGLAGIFLGPFYYYLIAPLYLIGGGNPVYPAVFLSFLTVIAIGITYYLGWQMQSRITGLIAAAVSSFSYYLVLAGRWLSNPTPIFLTGIILFLAMWQLSSKGDKRWWFAAVLSAGLSLHFEAASAVFYLPVMVVFWLYLFLINKSALQGKREVLISAMLFFITLLPQLIFNFRNDNILVNNFQKVLVEEKSFRSPLDSYNLDKKKNYFVDVFTSKIFPGHVFYPNLFYGASLIGIILAFVKAPKVFSLFLIFLGVPMIGYLFFQGNHGNIYDYYLTGYYLPMVLLFSIGLGRLSKNLIGQILVVLFFIVFFNLHSTLLRNFLSAGVDGPTHITLGNQLRAVKWVFEDAKGRGNFNVDSYVPPVIPHTYNYLYLWQGTRRCGENLCGLVEEQVPLLYTLYEVDPPNPERLEAWLSRQEGTAKVEGEARFGGILVQRRKRI